MKLVSLGIALRELSGGAKGFWIYLACLALGTAAIASAGSVTEVFERGLAEESRTLLGGDAMFVAAQRRPTIKERAFIENLGVVTETAELDVMGAAGDRRQQVDVLAVDGRYPLVGRAQLSIGEVDLQEAIAYSKDHWGVVASQSFLDALNVEIGDTIDIGPVRGIIRSRIDKLPDRLGIVGSFGPEAIIHIDSLVEAERLTTGQLFSSGLRVTFKPDVDFDNTKSDFENTFGDASLRARSPVDSVDGLQNLLTLLNSFLAIIGIAALVAGGVGVAQATNSFLETRIESIAALKALGADAHIVRNTYLIQLGILSLIGTLIGVMMGAAAPYLLMVFAGGQIPLPQMMGVFPVPLLKALVLGFLAAAIFALPSIGRARATQPSTLFRMMTEEEPIRTPWLERSWAFGAAALLAMIAILSSDRPQLTALLLAGALGAWGLFLTTAFMVRRISSAFADRTTGYWRLTLSNLSGPGSLAPTIVPALGLGLALLTLVVSVQSNLLRQISETAPSNAPSLIFSQIPSDAIDTFDRIIAEQGINTKDNDVFRRAPFLLARVVSLNGSAIVEENIAESEKWVVRGESRLTYLAKQPPDAILTKGDWWAEDYTGPPLVSVEADAAKGLGIDVGDAIGFRIFGREVSARVASLRIVDWGTFGIGSNTAFILSPGTLEAARPYHVAIAKTGSELETEIISKVGQVLPEVVVYQTRPALETAARLFSQIAVAVNAAAGVVTVAGLLVLLGAFAAMARKRSSESALLKTFGAVRSEVLQLYAGEFALAGGAGALIGTVLGVGAAYPIVVNVFEAQWSFPLWQVLSVIGFAIFVSAVGGAGVGIATLSKTPAQVLREC